MSIDVEIVHTKTLLRELKKDAPQEMHPKLFYRSFNFLVRKIDYFT